MTNLENNKAMPVSYEFYMKPILNMELDDFAYVDGVYYTIINDLKISIHFDMDDQTYNILTTDTEDDKVVTWDWTPDRDKVYRFLLQHIKNAYTIFAE